MAGFIGQAAYSVDARGRVAVPARMRNAMNPEAKGAFIITRGFEQSINLFPLDRWQDIVSEISSRNAYNRETRLFKRNLLMWAEEVTLDGQGRIGIPKTLADLAGITDRALIIGQLDHIEIWQPERYEAFIAEADESYEELAERVMGWQDG